MAKAQKEVVQAAVDPAPAIPRQCDTCKFAVDLGSVRVRCSIQLPFHINKAQDAHAYDVPRTWRCDLHKFK